MPMYRVRTRMVSHPVYLIFAKDEQDACRLVEEKGGFDPITEPVDEEIVLSVEKETC